MSDSAAARREDTLRLTGSAGANKLMEAELLRLVKRSPFHVRVPSPRRDGDATLLYPFLREVAFVAACYHRTSSRITWDLWSSPADRLEPLFADLLPLVAADDRLDFPGSKSLRLTVEVRGAADFAAGPLQLRGVVKNALVEGLASRGIEAVVDEERPEVEITVRRGGPDDARRTIVSLDLGGGPRHRRGDPSQERGERVAIVGAPLRETLAAQLVMFSRWDARVEPLIDPMTGGGTIAIEAAHLATGHAVRSPGHLVLARHPAFEGMPDETPDLFSGTVPRILASDLDPAAVPAMIGNLRAAGLTGPGREKWITVRSGDAREMTPELASSTWPGTDVERGVFCMNPPYGQRLAAEDEPALLALYRDVGRAFSRFGGWRVAAFVANPGFARAFEAGYGREPRITKPASNADLRGWFFLFER